MKVKGVVFFCIAILIPQLCYGQSGYVLAQKPKSMFSVNIREGNKDNTQKENTSSETFLGLVAGGVMLDGGDFDAGNALLLGVFNMHLKNKSFFMYGCDFIMNSSDSPL